MVPGSTFMYGSSFWLVTLRPRHFKRRPKLAAVIPFPRPETTPPVTKINFDIIFTQEDDADEKIKILEDIINSNRTLTNTDIEIIYLTVVLFMKSKLTKSELLLKISELTNQAPGLSDEELYEIKLFQKAFMKKFIKDDKLKKEIEKMISLTDIEAMKEIFPKESEQLGKEREQIGKEIGKEIGIEEGMEKGIIKTAENMKKEGIDSLIIAKVTGLSIDE